MKTKILSWSVFLDEGGDNVKRIPTISDLIFDDRDTHNFDIIVLYELKQPDALHLAKVQPDGFFAFKTYNYDWGVAVYSKRQIHSVTELRFNDMGYLDYDPSHLCRSAFVFSIDETPNLVFFHDDYKRNTNQRSAVIRDILKEPVGPTVIVGNIIENNGNGIVWDVALTGFECLLKGARPTYPVSEIYKKRVLADCSFSRDCEKAEAYVLPAFVLDYVSSHFPVVTEVLT